MALLQTPERPSAVQASEPPIRILVDSFADRDLTNAQMINAREIIRRLDPRKFHVSVFYMRDPDPIIVSRPNTRLIQLFGRLRTFTIFREFVSTHYDVLFYLKVAPASRWYLQLRKMWNDDRPVIGSIEAQCDYDRDPGMLASYVDLWKKTVLRCSYVFSNSHSVRRSLQREFGHNSEVVPTGVDTLFFTPAWNRAENPRLRVLFVGTLRSMKGPQVLLDAALRFPGADFILVGKGPIELDLKARATRERLSNVYFLGGLNREGVREEFRRADIFFFPSTWEGSPRVILEAAASGLPVVARKDYEPESVLDGISGYLTGSDEEGISRTGELLRSPYLRSQFGQAARKIAERFDWAPIVRRWEEIFLAAAAGAPIGSAP